MNIVINSEICKNANITIDTVLYLCAIYAGSPISKTTFSSSCSKGFIEFDGFTINYEPDNVRLTQKGTEIVEDVLLNSEFNKKEPEDPYTALAKKMQELYPKGKKNGTNLMWRDSSAIIAKKLKSVSKKYGVVLKEDEVLEATKAYVTSFNGDYQFMQVLKYFILKRDNNTGEENSQLLSYLENAGQESLEHNDWTSELR